jgi:lipoprotein NlpD
MKKTAFITHGVTLGVLLVFGLLAGCTTTPNSAPIVERGADGQKIAVPTSSPAAAPKVAAHTGDEHGYYTVKKGDTLTRIAFDNGQNYRDLVTWNNLANPNDIKIDQVLRVLPPDETKEGGSQAVPVPSLAGAVRAPLTPAAPSTLNKTGPRGEKRPYSDAAFAELQKPDAAASPAPTTVAVAAPQAAPVATAVAPPTAADKAAEAGNADEAVTWAWPAEGKLVGPYEEAKKGIDIAGKSGQQITAAASGKVLYAGTMRGYGNLVIVKHSNTLLSAYAHNKAILVKEGQAVTRGQPIAEMGDSDADSVKLHFEVRQQGKPVDPTKFLPSR